MRSFVFSLVLSLSALSLSAPAPDLSFSPASLSSGSVTNRLNPFEIKT